MSKRSRKVISIIAACGLAAAMTMTATGCSTPSEPVAATVNGDAILEQDVTDYLFSYRETNDLQDDEAWAKWLGENDRDAESMRQQTIDYFVRVKVIDQKAAEEGITVSEEDIDKQIAEIKEYYGYDDEGFKTQIESIGYDEAGYRDYVKQTLIEQKLKEKLMGDVAVEESAVLTEVNSYASVINGAKNIQVIVTDSEDEAKAALEEIKSGRDFAEVQAEKSTTTEYDGWDVLDTIDDAIVDGTSGVKVGEVSDVIAGTTDEGKYYVVKVNEICSVDPSAGFDSKDAVPTEIYAEIEKSVRNNQSADDFDAYVEELISVADVTVNPMPEGLPYDVEPIVENTGENADGTEGENGENAEGTNEVSPGVTPEQTEGTQTDEAAADNAAAQADPAASTDK